MYSVFIDDIVLSLENDGRNAVSIGGRPFQCLLYADDIVLMAERESALQDLVRVCEAHSLHNRYRFNASKCEVLATLPVSLPIYSEPGEDCRAMPQVERFTYLGFSFKTEGID